MPRPARSVTADGGDLYKPNKGARACLATRRTPISYVTNNGAAGPRCGGLRIASHADWLGPLLEAKLLAAGFLCSRL